MSKTSTPSKWDLDTPRNILSTLDIYRTTFSYELFKTSHTKYNLW